ncbi:MAG TPA: hypothetical protein VME41_07455 [Stellaceae bacterium]|nr:hypothetical protein [Stellaceae bacterium]
MADRATIEIYTRLAKTNLVIARSMALLEKAGARCEKDRREFTRDLLTYVRGQEILAGLAERRRLDAVAVQWGLPEEHALPDDALTVELEAHRLIRRHGPDAVAIARENAMAADETGDMVSAEAWRDIADEAERIMR